MAMLAMNLQSLIFSPLDIGCFAPLKEAYSAVVIKSIHNKSHKRLYHPRIFAVVLKLLRVLDKLTIKNITPLTIAYGLLDGSWVIKTPLTTTKVQKQIELIKQLINYNSESPLNKALH
ncbi:hypothetical protein GB937_003650 [Aspergillus fischeri]|nr:hypothetical protein GB937_003650 [Aspergillus fischeri]